MNDFMDLRQYVAMVLRWWWLLIVGAAAAAVLGYVVSQRQPRVYEAFTTLIVGQSIQATQLDSRDILTSEQLAQTYADIARRQPILQATVDSLQLSDDWRALKKRIAVKLIDGTQLLEIRAEGESPKAAQRVADEVARQLILISPGAGQQDTENNANQQFIREQLQALESKIESGQANLKNLETKLVASTTAQQTEQLQSDMNELERLVADWQTNYVDLLPFLNEKKSSNYLAVIEPAQVDASATRPRVLLNTLLASAVGLILALGLVFVRESMDDTFKSPDDLRHTPGLAFLGAVGRLEGKYYPEKLVTTQGPFSPASEAYRIIRSNIQLKSGGQRTKTLMVTSSIPGEGKSIMTANLAVVIAQAGLKTVIVDADLRRPVQHEIFEVANVSGLTNALISSDVEIADQLQATQIENLHVIPSGVLPLNPSELLSSERMKQLLAGLQTLADVVIFDSPPILPVADASVLSTQVDGVVLVIDASKTHRGVVRQAMLKLSYVGASLLGGTLNRAPAITQGYYYGTYSSNTRPSSSAKGPASSPVAGGNSPTGRAPNLKGWPNTLTQRLTHLAQMITGRWRKESRRPRPSRDTQ